VSKLITNIPVVMLVPTIFFLTIIGSYSINNNIFDVYVMIFFGVVGYVGRKAGFGPGPVVLGIILGKICEQGLVQAILMGRAEGSVLKMFFLRPISAILIVLTLLSAGWPFIRDLPARAGRKNHEKR
jgi:putative tricarboxylic transport membrane protein